MEKFVILIFFVSTSNGLFHEKSLLEYTYPLPEKALFGYSIAYVSSRKSLIVGAPNTDSVGQIFTISLEDGKVENLNFTIKDSKFKDISCWLGASVTSVHDSIVACAPRIATYYYNYFDMTGGCYMRDIGKSVHQKLNFYNDRYKGNSVSYGWSLHVTKNSEVLYGGPTVYAGDVQIFKKPSKTRDVLGTNGGLLNFGYSIASGDFSKDMKYAVSSPYGHNGLGQIWIYDSSLQHVETIKDDQPANMFGAAMCAVNFGSQYDYLVVGAPMEAGGFKYDVGAVYVYEADPKAYHKMVLVKKISGTSNGGYFGHTIISLGDIDGDGSDEVAIAAPYENDLRGTVYIYTGSRLINGKEPLQVIKPKDDLRYFGLSLTVLQDFDNNGCNELAIGAPHSNTVLVLRSFPSVTVTVLTPKYNSTMNSTNSPSLEFESCIEVTLPEKPQQIFGDLIVKMEISNGPYILDGSTDGILSYTIPLNTSYCRQNKVLISKGLDQHMIRYNIRADLVDNPEEHDDYNPSKALLSDQSVTSKEGYMSINNCDGGICKPVLKSNFSSSMIGPYTIGSTFVEWVALSLTNEGDTAYETCVNLFVSGASILKFPPTCILASDGKGLVCIPRAPLHINNSWDIGEVDLETKGLTSMDKNIVIEYSVYNHCSNESDKQSYTEIIPLASDESSFLVTGTATPDERVSFTSSDLSQQIKKISHVYKITNNGVTDWAGLTFSLVLPDKKDIRCTSIVIHNDGKLIECPVDGMTYASGYSNVTCALGNVFRKQNAMVHINIDITPELIGQLVEDEVQTLTTSLYLTLKSITVTQSTSTLLELKNVKVPLWMIIVAVLVGLLILVIFAFILYECGFLQRENKAQLKNLRSSVYRQTTRRSNEHGNQSTSDYKKITEEEQIETDNDD